MTRKPSIFHSKRGNKNGMPTHVVTGVYRLNTRTGLLLCAGTVYNIQNDNLNQNKNKNKDQNQKDKLWNRRLHAETATERFNKFPHKIQFKVPVKVAELKDTTLVYYQFRRLEKFIRTVFSKYGVMASSDPKKGLMHDSNFRKLLENAQETIFSDSLTKSEQDRESLDSNSSSYNPRPSSDNKKSVNPPYTYLMDLLTCFTDGEYEHRFKDFEVNDTDTDSDTNDDSNDNDNDSHNDGNEEDECSSLCNFMSYMCNVMWWFVLFTVMGTYMAYLHNLISEDMIENFIAVFIFYVRMAVTQLSIYKDKLLLTMEKM